MLLVSLSSFEAIRPFADALISAFPNPYQLPAGFKCLVHPCVRLGNQPVSFLEVLLTGNRTHSHLPEAFVSCFDYCEEMVLVSSNSGDAFRCCWDRLIFRSFALTHQQTSFTT